MQMTDTFGDGAPSLWEYKNASKDELYQLYEALLERLVDIDAHLHILADRVDGSAVHRQVDRLFERYGSSDTARRPPLFGVPVGVKDIFRVDGATMRCGSLLPPLLLEGEEAECVHLLREAGAIILAQTATTEFAYFEPAATRNPHDLAHTPGGSSSGSAAGVAAGAFPFALGTQTVGSVIRPASYCGVVGFKPSYNLIPTDGVMSFSRSVDHVGFFCRSVPEAKIIMSALVSGWQDLNMSETVRLGVPQGPFMRQLPHDTAVWFEAVAQHLSVQGVEVVQVPCLENLDEVVEHHENLIAAELAVEHAAWFSDFEHLYRPRTRAKILQGQDVAKVEVEAALASRLCLRHALATLMREYSLDAWCCPSTLDQAPKGLGNTGSPAMNLPWTHAGMPAVSLPVIGPGARLPLGLQLVGEFGADAFLLSLADRLEALLKE